MSELEPGFGPSEGNFGSISSPKRYSSAGALNGSKAVTANSIIQREEDYTLYE